VVREPGCRVRADTDRIEVDGRAIRLEPRCYVLLHKPRGVVSTLRDPEGRPTVRDLLQRTLPRLYPVGRLDLNSTGLILLTNDGDLAQRLAHPRHRVPKTYNAKVSGRPEERQLARLRRGIKLSGRRTAPAGVRVVKALPTKTWIELTVTEGRSHLVRRLFEAINHPVEKLTRVRIGPLSLEGLPSGASRLLTAAEVRRLLMAVGLATEKRPAVGGETANTPRQRPAPRARVPRQPAHRRRVRSIRETVLPSDGTARG
jgi:23S rRNA pseudouridine2605 synthase